MMHYSNQKVYITRTFQKFVSKHFSNYFIDMDELSQELKKAFLDEIYLKRPLMKFKIKISRLSYRVVGLIKKEKIIPILIFLKKDKRKGTNLIWNKELEILINHYSINTHSDIVSKNFKVY